MKLTVQELTEKVIPLLKPQCKSTAELKQKMLAYIDGAEIVDENGDPVEIEAINLTTAAPAEQEGAEMDDEDEEMKEIDAENEEEKSVARKTIRLNIELDKQRDTKSRRPAPSSDRGNKSTFTLPAQARRYGRLKSFVPDNSGGTEQKAVEQAYRFGMWCLATMGNERAKGFCREHGIGLRWHDNSGQKGHFTNINSQGGFLVPEEFSSTLIDLREQYGVFRRNARIEPMMSDTKVVPRRAGGLTAHFVGEGQPGTKSNKTWNQVRLTAKDVMILSKYTNQLSEDAVINIGDDLAGEISYAFALKEDECGFNGDGTSTYGGIVGVRTALRNLSVTIANIAGLVVSSGTGYATNWDSITLADFNKVVGALPEYAENGRAKWYCSKAFYGAVMERLMMAAGGNTSANIAAGGGRTFLNAPVEVSHVMPRTSATSQVACLYGDLALAAAFGDRAQDTIAFSDSATIDGVSVFETNEIAIRGTERFDINVHDVGNASATASERVAGPIVGLITASS